MKKMDALGKYVFHSGCVANRKRGDNLSRGAMLWVRSDISCKMIAANNWNSCQMVAVAIKDVLIISTYTIPGEDWREK